MGVSLTVRENCSPAKVRVKSAMTTATRVLERVIGASA